MAICWLGCLDEQSSRVLASALGDVTVPGWHWSRLIDRRVQTEVAHRFSGFGNCSMAPIADSMPIATVVFAPVIICGLRSGSSPIPICARACYTSRRYSRRRSSSRRRCSTPRHSSNGIGWEPSRVRPFLPNRSVAGHRSVRWGASTAWFSLSASFVAARVVIGTRLVGIAPGCSRRASRLPAENCSRTVVATPMYQS
ncbi:hypothetical protein AWB65_06888 [Caballeronia humi]|uniref:Uncharacterized protein n=1 Tax=Caballeronia humi TaxID=326474 RepID=A0A158JNH6_9BURK|nr:hypothetical protein AWB65_06888 [Caballeronia humi]